MSEIRISLKRIVEDGFSINEPILTDESKTLEASIGFDLLSDTNKNLLTIATQIAYVTPQSEIAAILRFRYTLEVDSLSKLQNTSNPEKGTHNYKFPNGLLEDALTDVYATGRIMIANHLNGTRLEGQYLPFGGARNLIKLVKKR